MALDAPRAAGSKDLVSQIESQPISMEDVSRMLGPHAQATAVIQYDDLAHFQSAEQMFKMSPNIIVLLQIETPGAPKVGHWIALLNQGTHYEHFDSYGISMDKELAITHEKPFMTRLMQHPDKPLVQSTKRLQRMREEMNTCGRWCVARVKMRDMPLLEFERFFTRFKDMPDAVVTLMTMFL